MFFFFKLNFTVFVINVIMRDHLVLIIKIITKNTRLYIEIVNIHDIIIYIISKRSDQKLKCQNNAKLRREWLAHALKTMNPTAAPPIGSNCESNLFRDSLKYIQQNFIKPDQPFRKSSVTRTEEMIIYLYTRMYCIV